MLQLIRDYASGWFALVITALIAVPFAMWGVHQYSGDTPANLAATVNGAPVEEQELTRATLAQIERMRGLLGANFNPSQIDESRIKLETLDKMLNEQVVNQAVAGLGMSMSDAGLANRIHAMEAFQTNGNFDVELYRRQLKYQGYTPEKFESEYRASLLQQQLQSTIVGSTPVSSHDLENLYRLIHQERNISYFILPLEKFIAEASVSEIDVKNQFDSHPDSYTSPEQVKVDYLELGIDTLAANVSVDEETLRQEYEQHVDSYVSPEQRRASHILIQVAEDADEATVEAAHEKIAAIAKRLKDGEDFAALAKEFSDDPESAKQGGDLGLFSRGSMVPEFEQAAFSMHKGDVSEPVRTKFGFHLIKLTDIKSSEGQSFEDLRAKLESDYRRRQGEEQYYDLMDKLTDLVYEHAESLEPAASALNLPVRHSGWVTRSGGDGIFSRPSVYNAAFSPEVLAGNNSDVIEIDSNHVVVLRVAEHEQPARQPFEAVKEKIAMQMREEKAKTQIAQAGEALLERVRTGESLQVVASDRKLDVKRIEELKRDNIDVPPAVKEAAFRLTMQSADKPVYQGLTTQSGDYVILALYAVKDGDPAAMSGDDRISLRRELTRIYGDYTYRAMVQNLRSKAKITIREQTATPE